MTDDFEQMKLVDKIDLKSRAIQKDVTALRTSIYGVNKDSDEKRLKMLGGLRTEALEFIGLLQDLAERIAGVDMEEADER